MTFPIKPLFDKVIVREIPVEQLFTEEDKKLMPFGHEQMKLRNRQGIVVAVGPDAEKHVQVEDRVYFEDTAMYEQVFVRPVDEFRKGIDTFWQLRVHDLKGVAVQDPNSYYEQKPDGTYSLEMYRA